ncbi:ABC-type phosphate transport system auxiliary subunit [Microbacterium ginsengiterrae]|uniref:ABC-type phosphate transport system auxiliary subunit n=1 Tax=Microbacterium ginsengiterrae TaxID=546115 RepID=A0A7W9FC12_9MICO|nr:ABC-type phosphate transport system auxiliary subunit [Microbacterium ginsengiterrae]
MGRLSTLGSDLLLEIRRRRAQRRLHARTVLDLASTVASLQQRLSELESDLDEVRADSRRVAELRIQVEDALAASTKSPLE